MTSSTPGLVLRRKSYPRFFTAWAAERTNFAAESPDSHDPPKGNIKPKMLVFPDARFCATRIGYIVELNDRLQDFLLVFSATARRPLSACDTVVLLTPARRATSLILAKL